MSTEFRVDGIPGHWGNSASMGNSVSRGNSVLTGEFRVDRGIPCRQGNSVSTGKFRVDGEIPWRRGNSVSTGKFSVDGGIPCVSTGGIHVDRIPWTPNCKSFLEKALKSVLTINISVFFFFFKNPLAD
jgi:hypothetical protein